jgi:uncharacterized protein (TIRG00374 family)
MAISNKKNITIIVKITVSLGLIVFLLSRFDFSLVMQRLRQADASYIIFAVFVMLFAWLINSKKWQILLRQIDFSYSLSWLYRVNLISLFYSSVLPGGQLTGEAFKCLKICKDESEKTKLIFSVLLDKIIGLFAFIIVGLIGLLVSVSSFSERKQLIFFFLISGIIASFLFVFLNTKVLGRINIIWERYQIKNRFGNLVSHLLSLLSLYQGSPWKIVQALLLGMGFQFLNSASVYLLSRSLGLSIALADMMWVMALVSLVLVVPITILGLGLREGSFMVFLGLIGVASEASVSLSLLVSAFLILFGLIGGIFELFDSIGLRAAKRNEASDKKRILMIVPSSFFAHRGCHIRILEETRALMDKGFVVKILTYHVGDEVPGVDTVRIMNIPWYKKMESGPSWHKIFLDFLLFLSAVRLMITYRPGIIHCHLHEGALVGIGLKFIFQKRIVFDSQGSLVDELLSFEFIRKDSFKCRIFSFMEKIIYRFSDQIIVSNKSNSEVLQSRYLVDAKKISIIPDGISQAAMNFDKNDISSKKKSLGIPEDKKLIVYLGTLNKVEGTELMLEIVALLKKQRDDFFVLVMGYPDEDYYTERAEALGIGKNIKFVGRLEYARIYEYLCMGDFAISMKLPTTEGNGKLLNYVIASLPVICFDHYSNRYILGDYGLYLDFEAGNEDNAKKIDEFLSSGQVWREGMVAGARNRLTKNFYWEAIVEDLIKLYEKIV